MKKTIVFLVLPLVYCFFLNEMYAQQLTLSNQYVVNKFSLSPAYAGVGDNLEVFGTYTKDWVGIKGAPETKTISANGVVFKNMGLGGSINSLQAGIFTTLSANFNYAYHVKISGKRFLGFGLGIGVIENHINLSSGSAQADPIAISNVAKTTTILDATFGVLYHGPRLHFGASLPRMITNKDDGKQLYFLSPHLNAHLGYKYTFNKDWTVDPVAVFSMAQNAPGFYEIAVPVIYKQKIWLTPIYKKTSIAVGVGGVLFGNFIMHYAYEFSSNGIMGHSSGTHEITIGWKMNKKKNEEPASDPKKPYYDWINK